MHEWSKSHDRFFDVLPLNTWICIFVKWRPIYWVKTQVYWDCGILEAARDQNVVKIVETNNYILYFLPMAATHKF